MSNPEKESGSQRKGLFDSDEELGDEQRREVLDWVERIIEEKRYEPRQAGELRSAAQFIIDIAHSVEDAHNQVTERIKWIERDLRITKLRGDFGSSNEELTEYITDRLGDFGITRKSITTNFCAPFVDESGGVPIAFGNAVDKLITLAFGSDQLPNILTDNLLLSLVDSEHKALPCRQIEVRIRSFLIANLKLSSGWYCPTVETEIPHVISFYWSGRAISKGALANVLAWAERAKGTDWTIYLWSDLTISDWKTRDAATELAKAGVKLREAQDVLDPRFRAAYQFARKYNLAGASDLVRLSVLRNPAFAGVYIDVDIAPGTIDLKTLSCTASPLSLPLFGPLLRDLKGIRDILGIDKKTPVTKIDVGRAVEIQTRLGHINNNFIVAQKHCIFLDPLINFIASQLAQYDEVFWASSGHSIAYITGPAVMLGVLPKILQIRDNIDEAAAVLVMTKNYMCTWPVEWITPDSEDQEW